MKSIPVQRCPQCGADPQCGIGGKVPCWCSRDFVPALALGDAAAACYCRKCLEKRIAEQLARPADPAT